MCGSPEPAAITTINGRQWGGGGQEKEGSKKIVVRSVSFGWPKQRRRWEGNTRKVKEGRKKKKKRGEEVLSRTRSAHQASCQCFVAPGGDIMIHGLHGGESNGEKRKRGGREGRKGKKKKDLGVIFLCYSDAKFD